LSRRWGPPPDRRPPWWPQDQGWPPPRGWRRGPPPFIWRLGCLFIAAITLVAVAGAITVSWLASQFGPLPVATFVAVLLLVLVVVAGRGMRRLTRPMDSLIDAAGRIERGDFAARVPERGPRQLRSVARAFNAMSARLQSSDQERRTFLADVVHELRTPLAVIRGQAEAIADHIYPPDEEHLAPIIDATRSLEVLVEDLRSLALTDAGSLVLNREPVDAASLLQDQVDTFAAQATAAGVQLSLHVEERAGAMDVDPVRLRSAIGNVVANAIAHTPRGGSVRLAASREGERVLVSVTDTGEGIPAELLPHVFERFVKGPGSKGTGLGLAIAHDIVVAHGGTIDIQSAIGSGSTVRMSIPGAE
jgi:two-component system sensor histidine kinase BaeS